VFRGWSTLTQKLDVAGSTRSPALSGTFGNVGELLFASNRRAVGRKREGSDWVRGRRNKLTEHFVELHGGDACIAVALLDDLEARPRLAADEERLRPGRKQSRDGGVAAVVEGMGSTGLGENRTAAIACDHRGHGDSTWP